jgi:hypothetical protein
VIGPSSHWKNFIIANGSMTLTAKWLNFRGDWDVAVSQLVSMLVGQQAAN